MHHYVRSTTYNGNPNFGKAIEDTIQKIIEVKDMTQFGGHVMLLVQLIWYMDQWWAVIKNTWGDDIGIRGYFILPLNVFRYFNIIFVMPKPINSSPDVTFEPGDFKKRIEKRKTEEEEDPYYVESDDDIEPYNQHLLKRQKGGMKKKRTKKQNKRIKKTRKKQNKKQNKRMKKTRKK
jgi:hypothetical protein